MHYGYPAGQSYHSGTAEPSPVLLGYVSCAVDRRFCCFVKRSMCLLLTLQRMGWTNIAAGRLEGPGRIDWLQIFFNDLIDFKILCSTKKIDSFISNRVLFYLFLTVPTFLYWAFPWWRFFLTECVISVYWCCDFKQYRYSNEFVNNSIDFTTMHFGNWKNVIIYHPL